jgi:hypothetical protein
MIGIIYKIVCCITGEVYFGSTTKSLNIRIANHKACCKKWKDGERGYITSFSIIERGNFSYSLMETVEYEDKKYLQERERWFIENNECINKYIPLRSVGEYRNSHKEQSQEYRDKHKEERKEKDKLYRELNKDKINEYRKKNRREYNEKARLRYAEIK